MQVQVRNVLGGTWAWAGSAIGEDWVSVGDFATLAEAETSRDAAVAAFFPSGRITVVGDADYDGYEIQIV